MSTVLVTGGTGFIGGHCILALLNAGHRVRTTVRKLEREPEVRALLKTAGVEAGDRLTFAVADLEKDEGWSAAVEGCEYVLHVASPFPAKMPKHEDDLIRPAREGALRVLRAARDAGVKRVVLTSSFAAIGYGHTPQDKPFDEKTWTEVAGPGIQPYVKSKTLAERAAWDFIAAEGKQLELAVVNPTAVLGPVFGPDISTSILIVQRMLDGKVPGCPKVSFGVVDVRDVADLHLRAMTDPAAKGERFLATAGDFVALSAMAKALKDKLGDKAKRVKSGELPNWLVRFASLWDSEVRQIVPELGHAKNATNEKAKTLLGWTPRTNEESVLASAESLMKLGLTRDTAKPA